MTKYKVRTPRKTNPYPNRASDCEQAIEPVFMAAMDAGGTIGQLSEAGIALLIEQAIAAGWTHHEIAAALIKFTIRADSISVSPKRPTAKNHIGTTDTFRVDPPNLPARHASRITECIYILEPLFLALAESATRAGWGKHETAIALAEIAVRQMHGIKRKTHQGSC
ncbi:hypothetical protein [Phyllobacterium phragmitis]|nr:hypothetical protein [Phyllobacterium phragmitis]